MRVWRGALVGFGHVAVHGHLPAWQRQQDFRIVAVCDADRARLALAKELLPQARVYEDLPDLLAQERIDFVDIATPPALHAAQVEAAASAGLHVLCEKPLATSIGDFLRMQQCVRAAGVVLHTVHNWRFSEAYVALRAAIARERLGPVHHISLKTVRTGCAPGASGSWRLDPVLAGGGILVDHGWHAFYLLTELAGEPPTAISALLSSERYIDARVEDTALCRVAFPRARAEIHLTWAGQKRHTSWAVVAEGGELRLENSKLAVRSRRGSWSTELPSPAAGSHHPEWFDGVIAEFRVALAEPRAGYDNLREAGLCVALLEQAYRSARRQGRAFEVAEPWT